MMSAHLLSPLVEGSSRPGSGGSAFRWGRDRCRGDGLTNLTKSNRLAAMKSVSTHEAKTHLSRILDEVSEGEVYVITRNGRPIAELRRDTAPPQSPVDCG